MYIESLVAMVFLHMSLPVPSGRKNFITELARMGCLFVYPEMFSHVTLIGKPPATPLAPVRPLTSVDSLVLCKATSPSEPLLTLLALVGPLTSVGPLVLSKTTSMSEPLLALLALVGPLTSVGPLV